MMYRSFIIKRPLSVLYFLFITVLMFYAAITMMIMVRLMSVSTTTLQQRQPYSSDRESIVHGTLVTMQKTHDVSKETLMKSLPSYNRKPRVFGYYFEYYNITNIPSSAFDRRVFSSKLSNARQPMELPVYWEDLLYELYPSKRTIHQWTGLFTSDYNRQSRNQDDVHLLKNSHYYDKPNHNPLRPYINKTECVPMHQWQEQSFPTCNLVHEGVDLTELFNKRKNRSTSYLFEQKRLLSNGYFRDTYVVADQGGIWPRAIDMASVTEEGSWEQYPVAFKTLRLRRKYDAWIYDRHRMDALVLDRMQKSDWIVDIYGFCGAAGVYEFGTGDMSNIITLNANHGSNDSTVDDKGREVASYRDKNFHQRLIYALDVANAITDLHTIDSYKNGKFSAVVHADIHMSQFVWVHDRFKLNDFNRCHFMFWNTSSNDASCPYHYLDYNAGSFRSPEEYSYSLQTEEIDVYSMGNIFFYLLMDIEPFDQLQEIESSDTIKKLVIKGVKPKLSEDVLAKKDDPSVNALIEAMKMCHVHDYRKRPRAEEVRDVLVHRLNQINYDKQRIQHNTSIFVM